MTKKIVKAKKAVKAEAPKAATFGPGLNIEQLQAELDAATLRGLQDEIKRLTGLIAAAKAAVKAAR